MRKALLVGISILALIGTGLTVAVASPGSGATRTPISRSAVIVSEEGAVNFKSGMETEILKVAVEPGGSTGWHSHPSPGIFSVDKGVLSNYGLDGDACTATVVKAGQGYFVSEHPHHAHLGRNEGTEPLELTVTYFNVPPGAATRIEAERPAQCPEDLK
jgi:quercetin dioxygenase-like cupin family protein